MARWWRSAAVALALACLCGQALAQPRCLPQPFGSGTGFAIKSDAAGRAFGWWCPDPYLPAASMIYSGPLSAFVPDWEAIAYQLARGSLADAAAAHAKYATVVYPKNASGGSIIPAELWPTFSAVRESLLASKPADPVWKVAPNPGFTTRPAFAYSGGIMATVATARATVDAACYCDTRNVVGSTVHCAVNTARTWMSACTRRN